MAMRDDNQRLTEFEYAALDKLLAGNHPVLSVLRAQLASAKVSSREFTGVGFFTNLRIDRSLPPALIGCSRIQIRDVGGKIKGLKHGVGFVLFITDGYIDFLEGFTYDEPWPEVICDYSLFYEGKRAEDPGVVDLR